MLYLYKRLLKLLKDLSHHILIVSKGINKVFYKKKSTIMAWYINPLENNRLF